MPENRHTMDELRILQALPLDVKIQKTRLRIREWINEYGEDCVYVSFSGGWEHVSIDGKKRLPDWNEMCELKDMFFRDDECCVEYHPPKSEYVNNAPYCLHIWKPIEQYSGKLPMPPSLFVGVKGVEYR